MWRFLPLIFLPASYPCGSIEAPLFQRFSRSGSRSPLPWDLPLARPALDISHRERDGSVPRCHHKSTVQGSRGRCSSGAGPSAWNAIGSRCSEYTSRHWPPRGRRPSACCRRVWPVGSAARFPPIPDPSDRSDSADGCGRSGLGSVLSTYAAPNRCSGKANHTDPSRSTRPANRLSGLKLFPDRHLTNRSHYLGCATNLPSLLPRPLRQSERRCRIDPQHPHLRRKER
jgi:hypothetical protein